MVEEQLLENQKWLQMKCKCKIYIHRNEENICRTAKYCSIVFLEMTIKSMFREQIVLEFKVKAREQMQIY